MRLTTVKIRNFRCIKDLTVDLDETTVLIGGVAHVPKEGARHPRETARPNGPRS